LPAPSTPERAALHLRLELAKLRSVLSSLPQLLEQLAHDLGLTVDRGGDVAP
jgi:hypothetical protein